MVMNQDYTYQIFTDATADLNDELINNLPYVEIIPMPVEIGGKEYSIGAFDSITTETFYNLQRVGNFASTSQINPAVYAQSFEPYLRAGKDILYLCFSSGLSGTYQSARLCVEDLQEEYPERKILCVDTRCGSVGEGFLVHEALKRQANGMSISELLRWVVDHRFQVCHWFTVDTFEHLQHGGRVSAVSAAVGTVLQIKPLLRIDENGKLNVIEKPRGRKKAISSQLARMEKGWRPDISKTVLIGHGDCPEEAEVLKNAVASKFQEAEILISEIGPIIGSHTGPGMLALIYMGDNR